MKQFLSTIALAGLVGSALAGIVAAQGAPIPIRGTDLTIYDPSLAANANEVASRMRAAIQACDRRAYDLERDILYEMQRPYLIASGVRLETDPRVHDADALTDLGFLYPYPDPCTRSPISLAAGLTYSRIGLDNGFGVGTVESGVNYTYAGETVSAINRAGVEIGADIRLDGDGFLGGRRWLVGSFAYASGGDYAEGSATVGVDGVTRVALTTLFDAPPFGTGVFTGAAGDSIEAFAESAYTWSNTLFGYRETLRSEDPEAPRFTFGAYFSYETFRQEHYGEAAVVRAGVTLADQTIAAWGLDRYYGVRFEAGVKIPLSTVSVLRITGYVTPSLHVGAGEIVQETTLGISDTQTLDYDTRGLGLAAGVKAEFHYEVTESLDLTLTGEYSVLTGVTQPRLATAPPELPALIGGANLNRAFIGVGLDYRF